MKLVGFLVLFLTSICSFSQNNYIVKTEDGRRVLLKADFTWEYIDMPSKTSENAPKNQQTTQPATKQPITHAVPLAPNCGYGPHFEEPKLNKRVQAHLKRSRATMKDLKKKVAKDYNCTAQDVVLLSLNETNTKGSYTFCVQGQQIAYKRVGNSFFRKGKLL